MRRIDHQIRDRDAKSEEPRVEQTWLESGVVAVGAGLVHLFVIMYHV
jgi:hypothetical protein